MAHVLNEELDRRLRSTRPAYAEPDEALLARLREHFSDEEIVELGGFVALTFGQQRVIKTWAVGHNELPAEAGAGLAEGVA